MKKMSPQKFKKVYLIGSLLPLLIFLVFFISGVIIMSETDLPNKDFVGTVLIGVSLITFLISILFIIFGVKRYRNIEREILQVELSKPVDPNRMHDFTWIKLSGEDTVQGGIGVYLHVNGFMIQGESTLHTWESFQKVEYVIYDNQWFLSFGELPFKGNNWDGFLFIPSLLLIERFKSFTGREIEDQVLKEVEMSNKELLESIKRWDKNLLLLFEKILFVCGLMVIGVAFAVILTTYIMESSSAIALTNLVIIPTNLIGYPRFFEGTWKNRFFISKDFFGYAWGRKHQLIPYASLYRIIIRKKDIKVLFEDPSPLAEDPAYVIYFAKNKQLISLLYEYKRKYQLSFPIQEEE